jgi:hypothetical protein
MGYWRVTRSRRSAVATAAILVLVLLATALLVREVRWRVERSLRARIQAEASRHGVLVQIETVRVGIWPPLRLTGVRLEKAGSFSLEADSVALRWRLALLAWRGRTRLTVGHVVLHGPASLSVESQPMSWEVLAASHDGVSLESQAPHAGLVLTAARKQDVVLLDATANGFSMDGLVSVNHAERALFDGGTLGGSVRLTTAPATARVEIAGGAQALRLAALGGETVPEAFGEPTDLSLELDATWSRARDALEIEHFSGALDGARLGGSLSVHDMEKAPSVDLSFDVERVDFGRLFRTSGLGTPEKLSGGAASFQDVEDLGSASLFARARGRLAEPGSFVVTQRLDFVPPRQVPAALQRLRGPFSHELVLASGETRSIDVSPASPDFIALSDVPPLFLRALLLAEDSGFYGHRGIDLAEMPSALITDWSRGGAFRGASTITQQLAKNLFLSRDKQLGRKLQELSLALLLESTLGKERILEIYLNVIEWGPGLYGLRPAARAYFAKEPKDLTPAEIAFLVSLIPGPIKYQSSFAHGTLVPGFRQLVDALLAKLRSVDALSEDEYQHALAEEIVVNPPGGAAARP